MELSEEVYYLDESRDWVVSSQSTQYINDEVRVETVLNQRLAKVRDISFQVFASHEIFGRGLRVVHGRLVRSKTAVHPSEAAA